ncbi:MAG: hypothetical protein C5B59_06155 [Bacteroidetes bacterium]|nr:MAG: hypothetical protein C5B59_06155 [Bacteroidota bacterium]
MKNYLFLFRGGLDFTKAPSEQVQQVILKWKNWVDELARKGIYNGGERLTRSEAAVIKGPAKLITDGPYTESKEIVGGYISIKASNLQEAIEIAKDSPIFNFDGNVEIREVAKP